MKTQTWLVTLLLAFAFLTSTAGYAENVSPGPWPFPWAIDCPMNWDGMNGRYQLAGSDKREEVDLVILIMDRNGARLVRIAQYTSSGLLLAEGRAMVEDNQNSIGMYLAPTDKMQPLTWAVIKLYYRSAEARCGEDNLVPIMTMETPDNNAIKTARYRLVKIDKRSRK